MRRVYTVRHRALFLEVYDATQPSTHSFGPDQPLERLREIYKHRNASYRHRNITGIPHFDGCLIVAANENAEMHPRQSMSCSSRHFGYKKSSLLKFTRYLKRTLKPRSSLIRLSRAPAVPRFVVSTLRKRSHPHCSIFHFQLKSPTTTGKRADGKFSVVGTAPQMPSKRSAPYRSRSPRPRLVTHPTIVLHPSPRSPSVRPHQPHVMMDLLYSPSITLAPATHGARRKFVPAK